MSHALPLRQALGAMTALSQFFIYQIIPKANGKIDKVPYREGVAHGVEDSRFWLPYDDAERYLTHLRTTRPDLQFTLGFAFTRGCGYWFVDADQAIVDGKFTEIGAWVYQLFPGAAFEISSSGTGFHLFGRGTVTEHSSRDTGRGLEFYTEGRGVAFGLSGEAFGSADSDHTHTLNTVWIPQIFPPRSAAEHAQDGPRADWRGPVDDADLIRRALQSQPMVNAFGNQTRATFAELWGNDVAALAQFYPDPTSADGINRSSADMALAQHLTFWTGCDAPRIERLMRQSGLVRPKWDEHTTYLYEHTISNACRMATKVCQDRLIVETTADKTDGIVDAKPVEQTLQTLLFPDAQLEFFNGCVYVADDHKVFSPIQGGSLLNPDKFNALYGGRTFVMTPDNAGLEKKPFTAFTQSQVVTFPKVRATTFRPDLAPGTIIQIEGVKYVNDYVPVEVPCEQGDVSLLLDHIGRLFPVQRDRDVLLAYMAAVAQYPGVKFFWCPVLQGAEGCGKGLLSKALEATIGKRYTYRPSSKKLAAQFNDWIERRLLILVDEIRVSRDDTDSIDVLKELITEGEIESEGKGVAKKIVNNLANFFLMTNWKDAMSANVGGRRFAIFYAAQQEPQDIIDAGMTPDYFRRLRELVTSPRGRAAITYFLRSYPIPAELDPTKEAIRAPATSSDAEMREVSRGPVEQSILDACDEGRKGFAKGWISMQYLADLLKEMRRDYLTVPKRVEMLKSLGYIEHPLLTNKGWTDNALAMSGRKERLFVKPGHPSTVCETRASVAQAYERDQNINPFSGSAVTLGAVKL